MPENKTPCVARSLDDDLSSKRVAVNIESCRRAFDMLGLNLEALLARDVARKDRALRRRNAEIEKLRRRLRAAREKASHLSLENNALLAEKAALIAAHSEEAVWSKAREDWAKHLAEELDKTRKAVFTPEALLSHVTSLGKEEAMKFAADFSLNIMKTLGLNPGEFETAMKAATADLTSRAVKAAKAKTAESRSWRVGRTVFTFHVPVNYQEALRGVTLLGLALDLDDVLEPVR